MFSQKNNADWEYRTLLIIWTALFTSQLLLVLLLYVTRSEVFLFDQSQPFIGEHYIIVPLCIAFGLEELIVAYFRHSSYLKRSVQEQDPELVRAGLIIALAQCTSISLCGLFLAFAFNYSYFYFWFLIGILGSLFYFPKRADLAAAGHQPTGLV
jgi:hypothetical protein